MAKNFVYLALRRKVGSGVAGGNPCFATYKKTNGELDFYVRSLLNYGNYGVEVNNADEASKTARALLDDGKLDFLYRLKYNTQGRVENGMVRTVPIYLVDPIVFDNR